MSDESQIEKTCFHCGGSGKCKCITCAVGNLAHREPGPCVVCNGKTTYAPNRYGVVISDDEIPF